eukprot:1855840-Prymnesium_polylepis.1
MKCPETLIWPKPPGASPARDAGLSPPSGGRSAGLTWAVRDPRKGPSQGEIPGAEQSAPELGADGSVRYVDRWTAQGDYLLDLSTTRTPGQRHRRAA